MLIHRAAISAEQIVDVRINGERITAVAPQLDPVPGEDRIDARGCALIPGLHDHHMHLLATAAALQSIDLSADAITDTNDLAQQLKIRRAERPDEIRVIGYHPGSQTMIDRDWLDKTCPDIPVRIQHQSGRLWILNSAAIGQMPACANSFPDGAERNERGELTGRFFHMDDWLREQLPRHTPELGAISRKLAACGVTGLTDAGPDNDNSTARLFRTAQQKGELLQRVLMMGRLELSPLDEPLLQRGAHKLYLKESDLPDYEQLCAAIRASHEQQRPVAFHCVTRVELQVALSALQESGIQPGDRIEHASIADDDALEQLKKLGITVVTQPHFISERGDRYLQQVEAEDIPFLYRGRSFIQSGIPFAAGTDAPFGHYDPWRAMRAAVERRSTSGHLLGAEERLGPLQALQLFTTPANQPGGNPRLIAEGEVADLCLLNVAWPQLLRDLSSQHVCRVWRGGTLIHQADQAEREDE